MMFKVQYFQHLVVRYKNINLFHFRLVQEAEQEAFISLHDVACTTISYSLDITIAIVYS